MNTHMAAVDNLFGLTKFVLAAKQSNFGVVLVGGLLGGILQPVVARFDPRAEDPKLIGYLLGPVLGAVAAGISIYVLANSDTREPIRLLFFSLLCGLAFPAILTSAVDNVARKTSEMQKKIVDINEQTRAVDVTETALAGRELVSTLAANPVGSVKSDANVVIEKTGQQAVINIAQTEVSGDADKQQVVDVLEKVRAAAEDGGWDRIAGTATEEINRLNPA